MARKAKKPVKRASKKPTRRHLPAVHKLRVRKVTITPHDVLRIEAHPDVVHQAVVHKEPGVIEIVPVVKKKEMGWLEYLFGDFA